MRVQEGHEHGLASFRREIEGRAVVVAQRVQRRRRDRRAQRKAVERPRLSGRRVVREGWLAGLANEQEGDDTEDREQHNGWQHELDR